MGSRAVVDRLPGRRGRARRFGIVEAEIGICYTRTGRRFFDDAALEARRCWRCATRRSERRFWESFDTDWVLPRRELMPWSAKAQELLRGSTRRWARRRASPASGGRRARAAVVRGSTSARCSTRMQGGSLAAGSSRPTRHYCWPVDSLDDLALAPFHLLATEGAVARRPGPRLAHGDARAACAQLTRRCLSPPRIDVVDLADPASESGRRPGGRT